MTDANVPLLVVDDLRVSFPRRDGGMTEAVRGVSFTLGRERLGIVGESGSGKSQTGRAIMGLTAPEGRISAKRLSSPAWTCSTARPPSAGRCAAAVSPWCCKTRSFHSTRS
jgi:ABC-type dipeptide/oligopeptide/nickel transport system ATPase component